MSYEQKCLYCHSEEVSERRRLTEGQWRRLIEQMRRKAPVLSSQDLAVTADDFLLPVVAGPRESPTYTPFRPRLSRWSDEMIRPYWVPPRDIAMDVLKSMNDLDMEKLFEKVP